MDTGKPEKRESQRGRLSHSTYLLPESAGKGQEAAGPGAAFLRALVCPPSLVPQYLLGELKRERRHGARQDSDKT